MPAGPLEAQPTLGAELRAVATARILRGAIAALVRHGLDATADDVATESGVSRRTVFRYFPTQGELFVAAIEEVYRIYDATLPEPPGPETSLHSWLSEVATTYHALNARYVGLAFWDFHVGRTQMAPEVAAALTDVSNRSYEWVKEIAGHAWRKAGGTGRTPEWIDDAFVLHLSAYATFAMAKDKPEAVGKMCTRVLAAVLAAAVSSREGPLSPAAPPA